jgi:hypothetical protein
MKAEDAERVRLAFVELNRIKQAVNTQRGKVLTPKRAEKILAPVRELRRMLKEARGRRDEGKEGSGGVNRES